MFAFKTICTQHNLSRCCVAPHYTYYLHHKCQSYTPHETGIPHTQRTYVGYIHWVWCAQNVIEQFGLSRNGIQQSGVSRMEYSSLESVVDSGEMFPAPTIYEVQKVCSMYYRSGRQITPNKTKHIHSRDSRKHSCPTKNSIDL